MASTFEEAIKSNEIIAGLASLRVTAAKEYNTITDAGGSVTALSTGSAGWQGQLVPLQHHLVQSLHFFK